MILMSPSDGLEQDTPVTTTYDAPQHEQHEADAPRSIPDWHRVDLLHAFCRDRAGERLLEAEQDGDRARARAQRREISVLQTMYAQARRVDDHVVTSCAVHYFRAAAMRDAHHPQFRGEWIRRTPQAA